MDSSSEFQPVNNVEREEEDDEQEEEEDSGENADAEPDSTNIYRIRPKLDEK